MNDPESAPPLPEHLQTAPGLPGQTLAPAEIHGGTPADPLAETHSVHTDNLQQPDVTVEPTPTDYGPVPTARPDLAPHVLSAATETAMPKKIEVFEPSDEPSDEEPSATSSMGIPGGQPAGGRSLMNNLTEKEPTAGPEEATGGQTGEVESPIKVASLTGGENYVENPEETETAKEISPELSAELDRVGKMFSDAIEEFEKIVDKHKNESANTSGPELDQAA